MKQFSIRDVLFLMAIVALALGWWFDKRPVPARFQITTTAHHAYVLDTATGQVWREWSGDGAMTGDAAVLGPKIAN